MSYVFSKALKETAEEKEKRLEAQRARWAANNAARYNNAGGPPPVAAKPNKPFCKEAPVLTKSQPAAAKAAFRGKTRSHSVDVADFGTGPKMGGKNP